MFTRYVPNAVRRRAALFPHRTGLRLQRFAEIQRVKGLLQNQPTANTTGGGRTIHEAREIVLEFRATLPALRVSGIHLVTSRILDRSCCTMSILRLLGVADQIHPLLKLALIVAEGAQHDLVVSPLRAGSTPPPGQ